MGDVKRLGVWEKAQALVVTIYRLSNDFPVSERYGLCSQMRRAAISVSANLAEGCGRQGDPELRRFIRISLGSLAELECEVLVAAELHFIDSEHRSLICTDIHLIRRMLQRLHSTLPSARRPKAGSSA